MSHVANAFRGLLGRFGIELLVLALFTVLTLVLFYPFSVLQMGNQLIGNTADTYQGLWDLWWMQHSTLSLSNPYMTSLLYYPYGANLYAHTLSPLAGFFTIPFQLSFGVVWSFNFLILLSFILGGYGAYQLAKHITHDKPASFFAGIVFTFSTYHFAKAIGDVNLVTIQWIPLYVLFLLRMRQDKSVKNVAATLVFLVLTAFMGDLQYILFLAIFTGIYLMYEAAFHREQIWGFFKRFGVMATVFGVVIFLVFQPLIFGWFSSQYSYVWSTREFSAATSGDLLGFFTPAQFNPIFAPAAQTINQSFTTTTAYPLEGNTYLGFSVLALTVFAVFKWRREIKFWLLTAFVFAVLSLGPVLHVMGSTPYNIPLPELLVFEAVPIFRAPSRMIVITTLCLAIIAAVALKHVNLHLAKLKNGKTLSLLLLVLLSGAFLAENNFLPYSVAADTEVPQFYYQLAETPGTFAVLDLPQNYANANRYMYYATVSGKPLLCGSISHGSPEEVKLREAVPLITQAGFADNGSSPLEQTDIVTQDFNTTNIYALKHFNIKYVILHKTLMTAFGYTHMSTYMGRLLGEVCYNDETITVYEVKETPLDGVFAYVSGGWYDTEAIDGWASRWIKNNGTIQVISPKEQFCSLNFTLGTLGANKTLNVYLNGQPIGSFLAATSNPRQIMLTMHLRSGENQLSFSSNQTFVPSQTIANSTDTRALSIYIKNLQVG